MRQLPNQKTYDSSVKTAKSRPAKWLANCSRSAIIAMLIHQESTYVRSETFGISNTGK